LTHAVLQDSVDEWILLVFMVVKVVNCMTCVGFFSFFFPKCF